MNQPHKTKHDQSSQNERKKTMKTKIVKTNMYLIIFMGILCSTFITFASSGCDPISYHIWNMGNNSVTSGEIAFGENLAVHESDILDVWYDTGGGTICTGWTVWQDGYISFNSDGSINQMDENYNPDTILS